MDDKPIIRNKGTFSNFFGVVCRSPFALEEVHIGHWYRRGLFISIWWLF